MMGVASWNVNSLRVRLPQVIGWLDKVSPDVVLLQETKLRDEEFPVEPLRQAGYQSYYCGEKTYNGVAILSKRPAHDVQLEFPNFPVFPHLQKRIIGATVDGVRFLNVYVPNGESVDSDKYQYKLAWLRALRDSVAAQLRQSPKLVVAGDFNIAPDDRDVYDPRAWDEQVLCSQAERDGLGAVLACGLRDSLRVVTDESGIYSWWDYRMGAFPRNRGLRIDLVLLSESLCPFLRASSVDRAPREQERPSDHAPVHILLDAVRD